MCSYFSATVIDDRVIFNFTDGKTCGHDVYKRPRNVVLTLHCQQNAAPDSQPSFIYETEEDCTYSFYWPRKELCRKEAVSLTQ